MAHKIVLWAVIRTFFIKTKDSKAMGSIKELLNISVYINILYLHLAAEK